MLSMMMVHRGSRSINDLICHAAHAQKVVRDSFCNKSVALAVLFWTSLQRKVAGVSNSEDEGAYDACTSLQGNVGHCQSTVRKFLKRIGGQGTAQDGSSVSQSGPSALNGSLAGSVDPDSGS